MTLFKNKYRIESNRLKYWNYSSDGAYFITICTKNRKRFFGDIRDGIMGLNEIGIIANNFWLGIPHRYSNVFLGEYVVMPNHLHGVIIIKYPAEMIHESSLRDYHNVKKRRQMLISKIIGRFKMLTAKYSNLEKGTVGKPFWQLNYHDRVIRNSEEFERIENYIRRNPPNWCWDRNNVDSSDNSDLC